MKPTNPIIWRYHMVWSPVEDTWSMIAAVIPVVITYGEFIVDFGRPIEIRKSAMNRVPAINSFLQTLYFVLNIHPLSSD